LCGEWQEWVMSKVKLQAARELIIDNHFTAARAVLLTMPTSATAQDWLARLDEIAPEEGTHVNWEYVEVFVKASERLPHDVSVIIEDSPFTSVDHFYTRLLNDYGAEGWELVSESLEGGDFYRLLFKRMRPTD
jgi:hypothetical protein